jgi:two-component system, NarL family, sensor kinase
MNRIETVERAREPAPAHERRSGGPRFGRRSARGVALAQLALSSVALLVVVASIGAVLLRKVATGEALQDARAVTVAFGQGVLREHITAGVLDGDRTAVAALDRAVHERVLGRPIVRVKVWTPDGRIAYSDARALIGQHFPLARDLRETLSDGAVRADVSDLSRPENRFERGQGRLVEVYLPLRLAGGRRVMVEAYHPAASIDAASSRIWRTFLPVPIALLIALAAVQLPLAWSHTRGIRAQAKERERLARQTAHALEVQRGRLAVAVHKGVAQELAGVAYEMQAAAITPPEATAESDLRRLLHRGAVTCLRSMTTLRELLVDPLPGQPATQDLQTAIEVLAGPLRDRGIEVCVEVRVDRPIPDATAELIFRAGRHAVRSIHPRARTVRIALTADQGTVTLVVEDDGRGPDDDEHRRDGDRPASLRALRDTLAARGGSLSITPERGGGTRVTAAVPRRSAPRL